ncbi:hypothetical protein [Natronosalvus halobius]|uniref:hypothetical protein n=1 Tax=Natronosalvus halobius TaxID=2953746 RepID=UPI00209C8E25|nr:hypothetical protein [Natronosalvus halobius]USZ70432.1 hypothetical protein NGM15_09910 [Natronosalvus halobius]
MAAHAATENAVRVPSTTLGGLVIVLTSVVLSIVSYSHLENTVRIRWTVGTYQHYGPEYISTLLVLVAFPVTVASLYVGARWLKAYLERSDASDDIEGFCTIYDICVLVTLGTVVVGQFVIIGLNL